MRGKGGRARKEGSAHSFVGNLNVVGATIRMGSCMALPKLSPPLLVSLVLSRYSHV